MNPTARSNPTTEPTAHRLLVGDEIAVINADDALLDRLHRGEQPDPTGPDPVVAALAAWLVAVAVGDAR
jgi:hypothetical protein